MTGPLLISIKEAGVRLGIGQDATYELVRSGRLRSVKIGTRKRKVPVAALDEFIHEGEDRGGSRDC